MTAGAGDDADPFVLELMRWRDVRGRSQTALAREMGFDRSYVSKVETGSERPTSAFASRAEEVLNSGGALLRAWREGEAVRTSRGSNRLNANHARPQMAGPQPGSSLIVEHDHARLYFDGQQYTATQRRALINAGTEPVTQYLVRIAVDRYPGDPEKSNEHYRRNPLTWDELELRAIHGESDPMRWTVRHDRDAFKEVWLLFENDSGKFPLYPGESTVIEYTYSVSETKWGHWFQRAVRLPTKRLSVELDFPTEAAPTAWGTETTLTATQVALRTAIHRSANEKRTLFSWSTEDPPMHARYRLEWAFRGQPERTADMTAGGSTQKPSEVMAKIGVVQDAAPILAQPARRLTLPEDSHQALEIVESLRAAIERIAAVHNFSKGMGLAAPQINIGSAVAIVLTPDGSEILLVNPRIIDESSERDSQYEGCLSFFDVRGKVPRSLSIEVEHYTTDGAPTITRFDREVARLVAHEIDHLEGILYRQRMAPGDVPIPVSEYKGTGTRWRY